MSSARILLQRDLATLLTEYEEIGLACPPRPEGPRKGSALANDHSICYDLRQLCSKHPTQYPGDFVWRLLVNGGAGTPFEV